MRLSNVKDLNWNCRKSNICYLIIVKSTKFEDCPVEHILDGYRKMNKVVYFNNR